MLNFFDYVQLFLKFFTIGAVFAVTFYYFFIRKNFLLKLPFEKFTSNEIKLTKFPISRFKQSSFERNTNLIIAYKHDELISFDNIKDYSNFCYFLNHYIGLTLENRDYTDRNSLQLFFEELNVSTNEAGQIFFPGKYNVDANIYTEIYCSFSEKSAEFFINYCNNRLLKLSIELFHLSVAMRYNIKFTRENLDQGLACLDFYYNSFIRNKYDALQLWYFLINLNNIIIKGGGVKYKTNFYGESSLFIDENYIKFMENYKIFTKKLTKAIKKDFETELSIFEKIRLNMYLLKQKLLTFIKKSLMVSLYTKLPNVLKPFFSLLPITILLFFIYNTKYNNVCSQIFIFYISILAVKSGLNFVEQLIHYDYNSVKEKKIIVFFKRCLKYFLVFLFNLAVLSFSTWFLTLDYFSFTQHNLIYLCVYLTYIIIYTVKYIIDKINKKNKL